MFYPHEGRVLPYSSDILFKERNSSIYKKIFKYFSDIKFSSHASIKKSRPEPASTRRCFS